MNNKRKCVATIVVALFFGCATVLAGDPSALSGGGLLSQSLDYSLGSTVGQSGGALVVSSADYEIGVGFWHQLQAIEPTPTETPTAEPGATHTPTPTEVEGASPTPTEADLATSTPSVSPTATLPPGPAYIVSPASGSILTGTAVTVEARTLQGSLFDIASVEFQIDKGNGWEALGNLSAGTNPDIVPPFLVSWDTLLEPTGSVQLRSGLTNVDTSTVLSPAIEITIDHQNPDTFTRINEDGNYETTTVVSASDQTTVHVGDPEVGRTVSAEVPPAAVTEEASLTIELVPTEQFADQLPPESVPGSVLGLRASVSNGQTTFAPPITLHATYPDADNDGIVDDTDVLEQTLQLAFLNAQGDLEILPNQVLDTLNNRISATTDHFSTFVLVGAEAPTVTPTETEVPSETPTETTLPVETETPTEAPTALATPTPTSDTPPAPTDTPTEGPSPTATNTAEEPIPTATMTPPDFECDSGYYVLDSLGGRHPVGNPYVITGSLYFGNDIARDMERAVCVDGSEFTEDLVVLDGLGGAHFVQTTACDIPQEFYFGDEEKDQFPQGRAVDLEMAANSTGFWVLSDFGGIHRAGTAKSPAAPALVPGTDLQGILGFDVPLGDLRDPRLPKDDRSTLRAVSLVVIDLESDGIAEGYVILDSMGGRLHYLPDGADVEPGSSAGLTGNEPERLLDPAGYVWPFFQGLDIARDMELHTTQEGVVILDGWDGIHPVPVDIESNPVFFANNRVSNANDTPVQTVGLPYVTAGFDDETTSLDEEDDPEDFGYDAESIFTDLEFTAGCPYGMYTLDKFGGVFVLGSAREVESEAIPQFGNSPYFFPFMYAEDMEIFAYDETPDETDTGPETKFQMLDW